MWRRVGGAERLLRVSFLPYAHVGERHVGSGDVEIDLRRRGADGVLAELGRLYDEEAEEKTPDVNAGEQWRRSFESPSSTTMTSPEGIGVAERPERGDVSPWERREVLWRNEEGRRGIGEGSATSSEENSPEREVAIWKWGTGEIRGASI